MFIMSQNSQGCALWHRNICAYYQPALYHGAFSTVCCNIMLLSQPRTGRHAGFPVASDTQLLSGHMSCKISFTKKKCSSLVKRFSHTYSTHCFLLFILIYLRGFDYENNQIINLEFNYFLLNT